MLHNTRGESDAVPFTSRCSLAQFACTCAYGQREKTHCRGAIDAAPSVPERRIVRLAGVRPSGPTRHAHMVVDERHIYHFGALVGPRRAQGLYDSKAFSIDNVYGYRHGSGGRGSC